ncbi:MAG: NAD(P)H-hydrate epimerase, partial [Rhodothermales bacterium]
MPNIPFVTAPFITTEQMIEVDRAMIEDYKILLIQMMENAGRNLADLARRRFLEGNPVRKRVIVLAGKGGNGGGGLVCARRLHNWGADVAVYLTTEDDDFSGIPAHQLDILQQMKVTVHTQEIPDMQPADLVIDAVIGYSLSGNPRGRAAVLINEANKLGQRQNVPI